MTEKRIYKAKMALRKMGSSVFHGGFSTFLAIFVLAPGKTYIFFSMFRLWFGIILFGMSNGFILLPVMLSFVGPVPSNEDSTAVHPNKQVGSDDENIVTESPIKSKQSLETINALNRQSSVSVNNQLMNTTAMTPALTTNQMKTDDLEEKE